MMRTREHRQKMRVRVGLDEFTHTLPAKYLNDQDAMRAWVERKGRRLRVPPGMQGRVEVLRYDERGRPVIRFYVGARRDTNREYIARLLSKTPERTPQ